MTARKGIAALCDQMSQIGWTLAGEDEFEQSAQKASPENPGGDKY